jgi:16S rRNA (adenine1518-N6/adenine1519-N6)-dimethyltransferase
MNNLINYGQHFLVDSKVVKLFVSSLNLSPQDFILEIGPGKGALTSEIAKKAKVLSAVEIDPQMHSFLDPLEKKYPNLTVRYENALNISFLNYDVICGALNYSIFEPLLIQILRQQFDAKRLVFLVSARFQEDFVKEEGMLYFLSSAFFQVEFSPIIENTSFSPSPKTKSVITIFTPHLYKDIYHSLIKELVQQEDKKLKNSLREALINISEQSGEKLTKKQAKAKLEALLKNDFVDKTLWQLTRTELSILINNLKLVSL